MKSFKEHLAEALKVGDTIKFYNMKTKKNKSGNIKSINKTKTGSIQSYEVDGGKIVYLDDII